MLKTTVISLALSLAAAVPLSAQGLGPKTDKIPAGHRPPAGMCRIWLDGVPAGQQPAPTDCATAVRNRPANGRVIFGDDYVDGKGKKKSKGNDERRTAPRDERDDDRDVNDDRRSRSASDDRNDNRGSTDDRKANDDDRKARRGDDARATRSNSEKSDTTRRKRRP
jgi:hypothetical protein